MFFNYFHANNGSNELRFIKFLREMHSTEWHLESEHDKCPRMMGVPLPIPPPHPPTPPATPPPSAPPLPPIPPPAPPPTPHTPPIPPADDQDLGVELDVDEDEYLLN